MVNGKMDKKSKGSKKTFVKRSNNNIKNVVVKAIDEKMRKTIEVKRSLGIYADAEVIDHYLSSASGNTSTIIDILQVASLTQGAGQGSRLANRINPISLRFKGYITSNYPQGVIIIKMFLFRLKDTLAPPSNFNNPALLQAGNSTVAPANQPSDMFKAFNRDAYNVYKTHTAVVELLQSGANANGVRFKSDFDWDLTKYVKSGIQYDDTGPTPINKALYVGFLVARVNSGVLGPLDETTLITYGCEMKYTDA